MSLMGEWKRMLDKVPGTMLKVSDCIRIVCDGCVVEKVEMDADLSMAVTTTPRWDFGQCVDGLARAGAIVKVSGEFA